MSLVRDGLQLECSSSSSEPERLAFGRRLKGAIDDFTVDFIPHMNEEEEVRRLNRMAPLSSNLNHAYLPPLPSPPLPPFPSSPGLPPAAVGVFQ